MSNKDGANNISDGPNNGLVHYHGTMIKEGIMQTLACAKENMLSQTLGGDKDDDCSDLSSAAMMVTAKVRMIVMVAMVAVTAVVVAGQWQ